MPRKSIFGLFSLGLALAGCAATPEQGNVVGDYLTGRIAARSNNVGVAADAFGGVEDASANSDEILRGAFFFSVASGDIDEAAKLAPKILANDDAEDDDLARLVEAAYALKNKNYTAARAALAANAQVEYFAAAMVILDAWALAGEKGPEAALKALAAKDGETFRGFHPLHQAFLFENAGLEDEARTAYQLSLMSYGGVVARDAYGSFLERTGDIEGARDHYELLAQYPGPDRQIAELGLERIEAGKTDESWTNVTPQKGAAVALYTFGSAVLQQSIEQREAAEKAGFRVGDANYDMPLAFTRIALYLAPDFDHAQRLAGSILNAYGDNKKAIAMLRDIPKSSAFYEQAQIEVAGGLIALDETSEAKDLLRALARSEKSTEARFAYANLLASEDDHRGAVREYGLLIDALPEDPPEDAWRYLVGRAASLLELDEWPAAEADLLRAVEIAPQEPAALNYLGYSWAERGLNLDEAFGLIEKAVAIEPNSGAYIDSLGWAHYQLGDYDEAVGHLEHAASLEPADPTITEHLGDVYWRLGRKIEARYEWKRVLELEPPQQMRERVEKKIEQGLAEQDS
ncbi:tetratricopeptide repeat protein [Hyphococcus sp.]|uniref:tetratricopeptide repeat protein n=1 Tax=Hyphococcus sp. TaxID=2038636 RepID=UPI0035C66F2A